MVQFGSGPEPKVTIRNCCQNYLWTFLLVDLGWKLWKQQKLYVVSMELTFFGIMNLL
jgi:hypothetical protein